MVGNADVIIYVSKLKTFLDNDSDASEFFYGKNGQDEFYELVKIFAKKNIEDKGEPDLTQEQFEQIRKKIFHITANKDITSEIIKNFNLSLN